jgi:F420-0:gamma-glutamyl ligase-like protein
VKYSISLEKRKEKQISIPTVNMYLKGILTNDGKYYIISHNDASLHKGEDYENSIFIPSVYIDCCDRRIVCGIGIERGGFRAVDEGDHRL